MKIVQVVAVVILVIYKKTIKERSVSEDSGPGIDVLLDRENITNKRWGSYEIISEKPGWKIKYLYIRKQTRISDQRHFHRSEHWFILQGELDVVINGTSRIKLKKGDNLDIPVGTWHWPQNNSTEPCIVLETQHGKSFEEDDIERRAY